MEQGLLLHYFYETESVYVDQMVCDLVGQLDVRLFEHALQRLVAMHESLRTFYVQGAGLEIMAVVREPSARRIAVVDLSAEADAQAVVSRLVAADAESPFDLSNEVSRCTLYRLEERLHVFAWTYHHVAADSWTLRLLQEQFCGIYRALLEGTTPDLARAVPYTAYIDWISNQDRGSAFAFWGAYLKRFTLRRHDPAAASVGGGDRACLKVSLPLATRQQVDEVRRRCNVTRNMVLLGMWAILVLDQQQTNDCLLGCVVTGRSYPMRGIETVAGVCANTVPIVIEGSKPIRDLFVELQRDIFEAGSRSHFAVSDVLASAGLNHRDLHSVVNFSIDEHTVQNRDVAYLPFDVTNIRYIQAANYDAYLDIEVHDTGIDVTMYFDPARRYFSASDVSPKCEQIVRYFAHHPDGMVLDLLDALLIEPSRFDVEFAFDTCRSEGSFV